MSSATSFQKKSRMKGPQISGTRPSLHNNQLLVSTGIPSLDYVIGGGLAVGTVLLIEEDTYSSYSRLLLKYYLSEGVMCNHTLLLASADLDCKRILKELPGALLTDPCLGAGAGGGGGASGVPLRQTQRTEDMTIAWRYQNQPQVQSAVSVTSTFGHCYDLTKTMDPQQVDSTEKTLLNVDCSMDCDSISLPVKRSYAQLLSSIKDKIDSGKFSTSITAQQRSILRIGIHSLGSPLWGEHYSGPGGRLDPSLPRFLYALRSLMRMSYSTCLITMPTHLFQESSLVHWVEQFVDTVVRLEAFVGTANEHNPAYKEYHGLLHLLKLPRLNTLTCHMPDTHDLAFKLRRKKFLIERLHLPPELSETVSRDQEDSDKPAPGRSPCVSSNKSKLDF